MPIGFEDFPLRDHVQAHLDAKRLFTGDAFHGLLANLADTDTEDAAAIAAKHDFGAMDWNDRWEVVRSGLSGQERRDIGRMLGNPKMAPILPQGVERNFLASLLTSTAPTEKSLRSIVTTEAKAAVAEFAALVADPIALRKTYDDAIGLNGPDAERKALDLFNRLPAITDEVEADELVALGLWEKAPQGYEQLATIARYIPGRQVLTPAKVSTDLPDNWGDKKAAEAFLAWDDNGVEKVERWGSTKEVVTYRATLVGEEGDNFLVKVDGRDSPISVAKEKIFALNQPHEISGKNIRVNGKMANYRSPYLKAKVCEAALKMSPLVGKLDFTKSQRGGVADRLRNRFSSASSAGDYGAIQRACVKVIHDVIDMKYRNPGDPGRINGSDAGRLAIRGAGVCHDQMGVMGSLLVPFQHLLGYEFQLVTVGVYRNTDRTADPVKQFQSFASPAHDLIQVTYLPSMQMRIIDRTWQQPDHPADRAYSAGGDRYPLGPKRGYPQAEVRDEDVVMDGSITVATFERQFGVRGQDDRSNHMSQRTDNQQVISNAV